MTVLFKPRASALGKIMTDPKSKGEILSEGAKTYLYEEAKKLVYGFDYSPSSKYTEKGLAVEDQSIELFNSVFFTDYQKNTERRTNDWVTGECDIFTGARIIDIKSCWSLATFPAIPDRGRDKDYEWQLRSYMMLWDVDEAEIAYCMVSTPDELIGYEPEELHFVEHIDPTLRVTRVPYSRDRELEDKIKIKSEAAIAFVAETVQRIADEHRG